MQYEINPECYSREIAAAVLRAAADQVVPHEDGPSCEGDEYQEAYELRQFIRHDFLAIAAELEQGANINTTETTP